MHKNNFEQLLNTIQRRHKLWKRYLWEHICHTRCESSHQAGLVGLPQTYPKGDSERKTALLYILKSVCCKRQNWGRTFHSCATVSSKQRAESVPDTGSLGGYIHIPWRAGEERQVASSSFFFFAAQSIWLAFKAGGHKCHTLSLLGALINKSSTTAHTKAQTWILLLSAVQLSPCLIASKRSN